MRLFEWLPFGFAGSKTPQTLLLGAIILAGMILLRWRWKRSYRASLYYHETKRRYSQVVEDPGFLGEYQVARILQSYPV